MGIDAFCKTKEVIAYGIDYLYMIIPMTINVSFLSIDVYVF